MYAGLFLVGSEHHRCMSKKKKSSKRPSREKAEPSGSENTPEDQDAKVIDRGESKLVIKGADATGGKTSPPRELEVEPRIILPAKDTAAEPQVNEVVESEVVRLQTQSEPGQDRVKLEKGKFEKLEQPDKAAQEEEKWGAEIKMGWWIAISGLSVAALLMAGLIIKYSYDGDSKEAVSVPLAPGFPMDDPFEGSPQKWLQENTVLARKQAVEILSKYVSAQNDQQRSKLVRDSNSYLEHVKSWQAGFNPRPVDDEHCAWSVADIGDTGYLMLKGRDAEFMPMRVYFVRTGETLKLDWHATVGWSAVSMKTIKEDLKKHQAEIEQINLDYRLAVQKAKQEEKDYDKKLVAYQRKLREQTQQGARSEYVVQSGDTLEKIAERHQIGMDVLTGENKLEGKAVSAGQVLKIPADPGAVPDAGTLVSPQMPQAVSKIKKPGLPAELYTEPITLRCLLSRRNEFYAGPYNDREHSAFMLRSPDRLTYLWGYVKRDSALDQELRRLLDHGRFVVGLKKDYPVTVRTKKALKDALPSQLELLELAHPGWVAP